MKLFVFICTLTFSYVYISETKGKIIHKFAITDKFYKNAATNYYSGPYLLKVIRLKTEDWKYAGLECLRYCMLTENCKTFVTLKKYRNCYLTWYDRCEKTDEFLRDKDGATIYEMRDNLITPEEKTTCFWQCLNSTKTCTKCGRTHCEKDLCRKCKKACWEISPFDGWTKFWVNFYAEENARCKNSWQLIFTSGGFIIYDYLLQFNLWLKVKIIYSNNDIRISYFENCNYTTRSKDGETGTFFSVGSYIKGNGSNYWDAPFEMKRLQVLSKSNCYNFFYDSSNCSIPQLPSYEQQNLSGKYVKGFIWEIPDVNLDKETYVANIEFEVTHKSGSNANSPPE
ncbi:UNVERIFIED_CONTAM: hypothetical protein RMT77_003707 [Armadillidium vulgare]